MAERVERSQTYRFNENAGIFRNQKGLAAAVGARRAALGQIGNQKASLATRGGNIKKLVVPTRQGEDVKRTVHQDEVKPRSRSLSVEPMEISRVSPDKRQRARSVIDIDAEDRGNEFSCAEYASEIYDYLKQREAKFQVPSNYMKTQPQINERMRGILVDWLVQVHEKFRLLQETLFLSVSFLDRYLAVDCSVSKNHLQLIGVTAMLLASKIEEIYTPEIRDFVYITDNAYTHAMIREQEQKMAQVLSYSFGDPLPIHFLRRNSKAAKADAERHTLAKYFLELTLPDYECLKYPPSLRAAAAICLSLKIIDNAAWNDTLAHYSHYEETALKPCMVRICQLIVKASNKDSKLLAVPTKYNRSKFFKIASSPYITRAPIIEKWSQL